MKKFFYIILRKKVQKVIIKKIIEKTNSCKLKSIPIFFEIINITVIILININICKKIEYKNTSLWTFYVWKMEIIKNFINKNYFIIKKYI